MPDTQHPYRLLLDAAVEGLAPAWVATTRDELETDARSMLNAVIPVLADALRQAQYRHEATSRDFGPAVHPDFGPDWILDLLADAHAPSQEVTDA
jgi:hypothetical protein